MSLIVEKTSKHKNDLSLDKTGVNIGALLKIFAKSGSFLFVGENKKQMEGALEVIVKKLACTKTNGSMQDDVACKKCSDCQLIATRQHPDICWIEPKGAASKIKIEDIRILKEKINLKPFQIGRKIFIIQDAHRMGPEAANALLKTLEEPPQNASVVLIAKSTAELLPTVVSRCKLLRFSQGGSNLVDDQQQIDDLICRIFEEDAISEGLTLYEDIAALERGKVEQLLYELAWVMRDILIVGLNTDKVQLLSSQVPDKIKHWAGFFNRDLVEKILEQVITTKNHVNKNANMKLAIDLLVKSINKYKFEK